MTIIPDDKDWTWVLETPCPECGFDASDIDIYAMSALVEKLARDWSQILEGEDIGQRPEPTKWSRLEYACHVRDVFRITSLRLNAMMQVDGVGFENCDQDETAITHRYDLQDPSIVRQELAVAADELAQTFSRIEGPLWHHRGLRSNGSEFTVATLSTYFAHDPIHHLWDVGFPWEESSAQ